MANLLDPRRLSTEHAALGFSDLFAVGLNLGTPKRHLGGGHSRNTVRLRVDFSLGSIGPIYKNEPQNLILLVKAPILFALKISISAGFWLQHVQEERFRVTAPQPTGDVFRCHMLTLVFYLFMQALGDEIMPAWLCKHMP